MNWSRARSAVPTLAASIAIGLSGCGSQDADTDGYRAYLEENSALLVRAIQAMMPELEDRAFTRAQSRYARARVRYSQIEPAAEMFPVLNLRIDGRPDEVPAERLSGFHRLERALWLELGSGDIAAVGRRLLADAKRLQLKLGRAELEPERIAVAARGAVEEILAVKLAGREEPYSQTALVDVSGNLEAVDAALAALDPLLSDATREAAERQLSQAYAEVGQYGAAARNPNQPRARSPGAVFVVFDELSPEAVAGLRAKFIALRAALARIEL
jgi:iron uptake system component EfeO